MTSMDAQDGFVRLVSIEVHPTGPEHVVRLETSRGADSHDRV